VTTVKACGNTGLHYKMTGWKQVQQNAAGFGMFPRLQFSSSREWGTEGVEVISQQGHHE